MHILGALIIIGLSVISVSTDRGSKSKTPFPYILIEEHHFLAGKVIYDAHRGTRVQAIPEKSQSESEHESHGTKVEGHFLRLVKKLARTQTPAKTPVRFDISGMTKMPSPSRLTSKRIHPSESTHTLDGHTGSPTSMLHTIHKRSMSQRLSSDHRNRQHWATVEGIISHHTRAQNPLTSGSVESTSHELFTGAAHVTNNMADDEPLIQEEEEFPDDDFVFKVMETDLFYIDDEDYIAVANSSTFLEYDAIEFYVYLSNQNGDVLSTPLAFIIYIDQPGETTNDYPAVPAIFAGVLVLFIVFLALFIPFVTRAKRRYRQGKPVFKMGSHPSMVELDPSSILRKVETREPNWYGNNTMFSYEEEVQKERSEFTTGIKQLSKKNTEPPTLQLHKKVKSSSSSSSLSEAATSTQDDTKPIQPRKKKSFRERFLSHP